jgi:hypothetical protein
MIGTNGLEVGAQLAVAGGTLVLAAFTAWMAHRTHEVAEQAKDQVAAADREAKATENLAIEARTDRQLAWRPQVELSHLDRLTNNDSWNFRIRNSGPGPALQVVSMARDVDDVGRWCLVRFGDLVPAELQARNGPRWTGGGAVSSPFEDIVGATDGEVVLAVVMCSDILGRRFRFGYARAVYLPPTDKFLRPLPPEVSALSENHPAHTGWAAEPMVWG